ncbi:hypothetical protein NDU88_000898 [Pleurodeles waltl]|uniref:Uncharacterized protein n=1 Tax=Pleurodeles waltl TaxID=8319 RepID=A0AAV7TH43_PLEWA|nr:hypothetical protein NDU88_000898 [Pleurodeles waltl]
MLPKGSPSFDVLCCVGSCSEVKQVPNEAPGLTRAGHSPSEPQGTGGCWKPTPSDRGAGARSPQVAETHNSGRGAAPRRAQPHSGAATPEGKEMLSACLRRYPRGRGSPAAVTSLGKAPPHNAEPQEAARSSRWCPHRPQPGPWAWQHDGLLTVCRMAASFDM